MSTLIGKDDLESYTRRVDTLDDDLAIIVINAASDMVKSYCEQDFEYTEDETIRLDGTGTGVLVLPELPVLSVSEVIYDPDGDDPETLVVDEDYRLADGGLLIRLPIYTDWTYGIANFEVTYTHGYATDSVPADLRLVALDIAAILYEAGPVEADSIGGYSARYRQVMGPTHKAILDKKYRHRRIS